MHAALPLLKKYWPALLAALVLLGIALAFIQGYRLGAGFAIVKNGALVLRDLPEGTTAYADSIREAKSKNGMLRMTLTPGTHSVIVEAPGMQPWSELFDVTASQETELAPFLVPAATGARMLSGEEKRKADYAIWNQKFPTSRAPLVVAHGCAAVRVNGSSVIADPVDKEGCVPPPYLCEHDACTPVISYEARDQVRTVLAYPGREDALIIATGGLLYVVELDPREPQFVGELWRGSLAFAAPWSASSVVVTDGAATFEIPLP